MKMHNPPHPGGVLLRQWIEPLGIPLPDGQASGVLARPFRACARTQWGESGDGVRLSIALDQCRAMDDMQSSYDLWHAEQHRTELKVESVVAGAG